jgi:3beta-hydroxy-delta5-steroid dehydrogenase/steroid delta-isomerase
MNDANRYRRRHDGHEGNIEQMDESKASPIPISQLGVCFVTGAAGFLGRNLVRRLLREGLMVRALVRNSPLNIEHEHLSCIRGDVCNLDDLLQACEGVDTVFHTAALISLLGGIAAREEYRDRAWQVNVVGTQNVIDACVSSAVKRLIYTSSVDVCFEGKPLPDMKESLPYARRFKSVYAQTKVAAEKRVLEADGASGLRTCAIRPDGIYGAEPNDMIDRFAKELMAGKLVARIGSSSVLQDNSHIDNLVEGELLAAQHLIPNGVACGQAYFIGDAEPMNSFEFFRPLIEGLGHPFPQREIPVALLKPVMHVWQAMHFIFGLPKPLLSPHELDKVSITHYASIEKARAELGYAPKRSVAEAMEEILKYCESKR